VTLKWRSKKDLMQIKGGVINPVFAN